MQNTLTFPSLRPAGGEADPTFNVVIAYEDFETGKNAKKTYDFLVEHLGNECVFSNQMWKFDVLSLPKLKEMAIADAREADIIIVSAHGNNDMPGPVKGWIEQWLAEKPRAIALVGLFDAESYLQNLSSTYLADVARRGGMEFFSQPGVWPGGEKGAALAAEGDRADRTISVLAEMVQQDSNNSRWGINE